MATATPSSRWRSMPGCSSASCWKSCFTDVAERWNSTTPPVSCARLPISTTRGMCVTQTFVRPRSLSAFSTLGGDIGSSVNRMPVAFSMALAMAPSGGTIGVSPTPRTP